MKYAANPRGHGSGDDRRVSIMKPVVKRIHTFIHKPTNVTKSEIWRMGDRRKNQCSNARFQTGKQSTWFEIGT